MTRLEVRPSNCRTRFTQFAPSATGMAVHSLYLRKSLNPARQFVKMNFWVNFWVMIFWVPADDQHGAGQ